MIRSVAVAVLAAAATTATVTAQRPDASLWYQGVGVSSTAGDLSSARAAVDSRFRVMLAWNHPRAHAELAWETVLSAATATGTDLFFITPGDPGDLLPLQGTIDDGAHHSWRHRVDRMFVELGGRSLQFSVGRQPVSWATTLTFTPADPFRPFDAADPFREYRAGVDAARVRYFPGPLTQFDAVVMPSDFTEGATITALARASTSAGPLELSGWAGALHDEPAGALAGALTVLEGVLRAEAVAREVGDETVLRAAAGLDRSFEVGRRRLYVAVEYQYDELGLADFDAPAIPRATSRALARGELQTIGRHEAAIQATYQLHPLIEAGQSVLASLQDHSVLMAPAVAWSASESVSVRAGAFLALGPSAQQGIPRSEYGSAPATGYVAMSAYF